MLTRACIWLLIVGSLYAIGGVRAAANSPDAPSSSPRVMPQLPTVIQQARLSAGDPGASDSFGDDVAVSGSTVVVGAALESGGIGDPLPDAGAAYIFERDAGGAGLWDQVEKLTAADAQAGDRFGRSVAISGNTIVVGAHSEDFGRGDPRPNAGAAYVFERDASDPNNWVQVKKLTAADAQASDAFGISVAISGNTIVVGAYTEDFGRGDPRPSAGAAYVFERDASDPNNWVQVRKLIADDAQAGDTFGISVAISGNTIVVGARFEDGGAGDPLLDVGAAYVFDRNQGGPDNWGQVRKLTAGDPDVIDRFGSSVSVSGRIIVVGAPQEGGGPGDPHPFSGAAYVYERNRSDPTSWTQIEKLTAGDARHHDRFGWEVSVAGSTIIVGAFLEDGGPGDPLSDTGAAYLFERDVGGPGTWDQVAKILASDRQEGDQFGWGVAVSPGRTLVVGAHREDGGAGDPLPNAGAAYLYCPDDDLEFNDTLGSAPPLAPGIYHNLQLCSGDLDYYRLTAMEGDTIELSATFFHAEGNLDLRLYDGEANVLAVSDSTTNNEVISHQAPASGVYFLGVAGAAGGEINRYTLTGSGFNASVAYVPLLTTGGP